MMETKLSLYIVARNKTTYKYDVLSIENDKVVIPSCPIKENEDISTQLFHLTKQYIDIDKNVINYIFLDVKIKNILDIIYFCCVPINIPITNCHFIPMDKNQDHVINLQKIINIV